jgi:MFS family permease
MLCACPLAIGSLTILSSPLSLCYVRGLASFDRQVVASLMERTADGPASAPFRRDELTWLAFGMLGFYNYLLSGLGPLMPSLRKELGLSYTVASLHFSAFAVGMILAGLAGDRVVRRYGRTKVFWAGAAGLVAGAVALTLFHSAILTVGSVLLMGGVGSLVLVLIPAILADRHGMNRAIAIVEANTLSAATGAMAGLLIGLSERTSAGWRGALLLSLAIPLFLVIRLGRVALPAAQSIGARRHASTRLPLAYWAFWLGVVLVVATEFSLIFWGADFLVAAGLSTGAAATTVSLFLWGMVAGRIAGRQIARWMPAEQLLLLALAVSGGGFFVYWLAPAAPAVVLGLFVAGVGVANLYPLIVALALGAAPGQSNEAGARLTFASGTAILAAPLLLGTLADATGIRLAYGVVPIFLLGALVASGLGRRLSQEPAADLAPR